MTIPNLSEFLPEILRQRDREAKLGDQLTGHLETILAALLEGNANTLIGEADALLVPRAGGPLGNFEVWEFLGNVVHPERYSRSLRRSLITSGQEDRFHKTTRKAWDAVSERIGGELVLELWKAGIGESGPVAYRVDPASQDIASARVAFRSFAYDYADDELTPPQTVTLPDGTTVTTFDANQSGLVSRNAALNLLAESLRDRVPAHVTPVISWSQAITTDEPRMAEDAAELQYSHRPLEELAAPGDNLEFRPTCVQGCMVNCESICQQAGCENACVGLGACESSCTLLCENSCVTDCEAVCQQSCVLSCTDQCQSFCTNACEGASCTSLCESSCTGVCEGGNCQLSCTTGVEDGCAASCQVTAEFVCVSLAESACVLSCQARCEICLEDSTCLDGCEVGGCEASCEGSAEACVTTVETSYDGDYGYDDDTDYGSDGGSDGGPCSSSCESQGCQNARREATGS